MKLLQLSSCLFSTLSIHAYYARNPFYHHIFLIITMLSILNHQEYNSIIKMIDIFVAHYAYFQINISDAPLVIRKKPLMVMPSIIIPLLYWCEFVYPFYEIEIHFILHFLMVATLHSYLYLIEN